MNGKEIGRLYKFTYKTLQMNVDGVAEEEAHARDAKGANSINWVFGHVVATRDALFGILGVDPVLPEATRAAYTRGASPDREKAVSLSEITDALHRSQSALLGWLEGRTDDDLARPLAQKNEFTGDSIGSALGSFLFHESYHAGQLGLLRRLVGKDGAIK